MSMMTLKSYIINGWPAKSLIPKDLMPYYATRFELSVHHDVIYRGTRAVIPPSLRQSWLSTIHEGHQGIVKCQARARQAVWWPGMSTAIESLVTNCRTCAEFRPNPAEPLQSTPFPDLPWDHIATDLCEHNGHTYLVVVDYFSRYIEIIKLPSTTSSYVISTLDGLFATHGIPRVVVSDNGPQFASAQFRSFASRLGFTHRTSSPRHPQSNGEAERAVRTAKDLLRKNTNLAQALRAYRATPLANGYSPSQLLFGRQIRTSVTAVPTPPQWPDLASLKTEETTRRQKQAATHDRRHRARPLPSLSPGDEVFITDLHRTGTVRQQLSDRSYTVSSGSSVLRRNRTYGYLRG